ncbi:unnamed protein product, partial [Mesorhabditis belari]|uniref:Uncharacterized protein n=1 Tax=Mesorhabditis belari TaxID=2138241 RepID=A0AAF3ER14_9BILA
MCVGCFAILPEMLNPELKELNGVEANGLQAPCPGACNPTSCNTCCQRAGYTAGLCLPPINCICVQV